MKIMLHSAIKHNLCCCSIIASMLLSIIHNLCVHVLTANVGDQMCLLQVKLSFVLIVLKGD